MSFACYLSTIYPILERTMRYIHAASGLALSLAFGAIASPSAHAGATKTKLNAKMKRKRNISARLPLQRLELG